MKWYEEPAYDDVLPESRQGLTVDDARMYLDNASAFEYKTTSSNQERYICVAEVTCMHSVGVAYGVASIHRGPCIDRQDPDFDAAGSEQS